MLRGLNSPSTKTGLISVLATPRIPTSGELTIGIKPWQSASQVLNNSGGRESYRLKQRGSGAAKTTGKKLKSCCFCLLEVGRVGPCA